MAVLEKELLNGQKLQGASTAKEVYEFLKNHKKANQYPLFSAVHKIVYEGLPPTEIISVEMELGKI